MLATAIAATTSAYANTENKTATEPKMYLAVLDVSNKVARNTNSLQYSVSNKNLQLCWTAKDMKFDPANNNKVLEVFTTPSDKSVFMKPGSTVTKEGNVVYIRSTKKSEKGEHITACWRFDNTDPLGKYNLGVQINDVQFSGLQFELVK